MNAAIIDIILSKRNEIDELWSRELNAFKSETSVMTPHMYNQLNKEFLSLLIHHISQGDISADGTLERFFDKVLRTNMPLEYLTQGLQTFRRIVLEIIIEEDIQKDTAIDIYREVDRWMDPILNSVVQNSSQIWERTVSIQKSALLELSAPLIPVFQHISVMPLIGTIDTERAKLIMENLLEGVIQYRSQVVLIDITGVPVVDTMVAHHIIQAADAVRLLGSTCILVGIRPEIAQTIVSLGIDLSLFPTKSTLQKGMERALEITNQQIVKDK
ncbi:STAS domain-containing protein [Fictibacillus sp. KIGAM418]|uniref:STAS domain-containing protein n=1 Tax=Fictibacillus marinisediminis TaxID=2878389 RepID=A0A9X1X6Z9_9BACL|nr:STAS domain-containing protein [Fictibacillus marinisediminis]MCK6255292.1 STAS domain-containing protein [Fictibacillus marinisediminis]